MTISYRLIVGKISWFVAAAGASDASRVHASQRRLARLPADRDRPDSDQPTRVGVEPKPPGDSDDLSYIWFRIAARGQENEVLHRVGKHVVGLTVVSRLGFYPTVRADILADVSVLIRGQLRQRNPPRGAAARESAGDQQRGGQKA